MTRDGRRAQNTRGEEGGGDERVWERGEDTRKETGGEGRKVPARGGGFRQRPRGGESAGDVGRESARARSSRGFPCTPPPLLVFYTNTLSRRDNLEPTRTGRPPGPSRLASQLARLDLGRENYTYFTK